MADLDLGGTSSYTRYIREEEFDPGIVEMDELWEKELKEIKREHLRQEQINKSAKTTPTLPGGPATGTKDVEISKPVSTSWVSFRMEDAKTYTAATTAAGLAQMDVIERALAKTTPTLPGGPATGTKDAEIVSPSNQGFLDDPLEELRNYFKSLGMTETPEEVFKDDVKEAIQQHRRQEQMNKIESTNASATSTIGSTGRRTTIAADSDLGGTSTKKFDMYTLATVGLAIVGVIVIFIFLRK